MKIKIIIDSVKSNRFNITNHAREEAKNDLLLLDDIIFSTCNGEVIKDYPNDKPYPSCLIYGKFSNGEPIHNVWAYDSESEIAILITTYRPDPDIWYYWKERKNS